MMRAAALAPSRGRALALRGLITFLVALLATVALAGPNYPALSGRIVDQANVIPEATRDDLRVKLKDLEDKSGIQLVVATIRTLDGADMETYANGLFRFWKLGDAKKNNGVLFVIAPRERKMRIEVGYGLEGTLTDALSKVILTSAVAPKLKSGDYGTGIERGVEGIIEVLSGDSAEWVKKVPAPPTFLETLPLILLALFIFVFIMMARSAGRPGNYRRYRRGGPPIIILPPSGGWDDGGWSSGGGWGGNGGGFDDFSGGGGSSGGGGASGDW